MVDFYMTILNSKVTILLYGNYKKKILYFLNWVSFHRQIMLMFYLQELWWCHHKIILWGKTSNEVKSVEKCYVDEIFVVLYFLHFLASNIAHFHFWFSYFHDNFKLLSYDSKRCRFLTKPLNLSVKRCQECYQYCKIK